MPKDILIYGEIDDFSVRQFFKDIDEALEVDANAEICVRVNTEGGSPEYAWGIISKFNELKGLKYVKNDGKSYSMGLYINCYVENASALDTTQFILHRAAYPSWLERDDEMFSDAMRTHLDSINKKLRAAFEAKVDVEKFENLPSVKSKGITLDMVFSMEGRIDVPLTAKEAKQIGLIKEIVNITPKMTAQIESYMKIAASSKGILIPENQSKTQTNKSNNMTIDELKSQHPSLYAQVIALGMTKERERIEAIMVFNDVDPIGVSAAIKEGKELSPKDIAEFSLKATHKMIADKTKEDSAGEVTTAGEDVKATEKEKVQSDFLAEAKASIK